MPLVENNAAFFADFGVPATIAGAPVAVIFDNEYMASLDVESSNPLALASAADVAAVAHGDAVVIGTASYTIAGIQPDGTGFTILELEKV